MAKRLWVAVLPVALLLIVGLAIWAESRGQVQARVPIPLEPPVAAAAAAISSAPAVSTRPPTITRSAASSTQNLSATRVITVPILMYHHVGNPDTYQTYSVDNAMFEWQMDYLDKQGYHTVSLDDIAAALTGTATLPDKPIAITFDDGWILQITNTLPVLLRHSFKATYYIIVNVTGHRAGNMTWEQVRQLRDAGMWIGSHTLSHGYLPGMSNKRLKDELVSSKNILEQQLSMTITSLAYPGGARNARVEQMTMAAGYTSAVTTIKGYTQRSDLLYRLQRVGVYGVDTQERFIAKVDQTFFKKVWPYPSGQATLVDPNPER